MTATGAADAADPVRGSMVVLHVFESPSAELTRKLQAGDVRLSDAVVTLRQELSHRLDLLAFAASGLEELGWDVRLAGEDILATSGLRPEEAREQLEDNGITGPMCVVCDLDDTGWPVIRPLEEPLGTQ